MTHHRCTTAQRAALELIAALEAIRPHALWPNRVDADLYEARMILDHLADHANDMHVADARRAVAS